MRRIAIAALCLLASAVTAGAQGPLANAAGLQAPVLRAARDIPRGATIAAADIAADSSADAAAVDGWVTKRLVRRGEALREPAIARPQLIKQGTLVKLQASVDGVTVERDGTALNGGSLGDVVRVRLDAQRTVTGTVAGPATIKLP